MRESTCIMNLGEDRRDGQSSLSPRLLPVLVLLKVWGEVGEEPCDRVDLVLLLLEAVCTLENRDPEHEKATSLESLAEKLTELGDDSLSKKFRNYAEESAKSLTSFMDLFEKSLARLTTYLSEGDENTDPPPLSMSPFNPVLAVFVSQCVSAFQFLTFSQVVRLHRQWANIVSNPTDFLPTQESKQGREDKIKVFMEREDFQSALSELTVPSSLGVPIDSEGKDISTEHQPSTNALRLATLHDYFGHKEEGTKAIREAIRFALHENDTKLLQHCLAWLHRLHPFPEGDSLSVLTRLSAKAQELHQPLLAGWGRLEESKEMLKLRKDPKEVLQMALSGGSGDSVPLYGGGPEKTAHRGATLATLAKIWDHYGFSHVGQLFCQLQGHVMSCDPIPTELEGRESCIISISLMARHLFTMGDYKSARALFKSAEKMFGDDGSKSQKLLSQCMEEIGFDWAIQTGDVATARKHLNRLQSLDDESSILRSALLHAAVGNYTEAQMISLKLLKTSSPYTKCRALELLAEVECVNGRPSFSLPYLMESLALCKSHHLSPCTTQLWLAQAQLQLGCHYACASLASECLLHFQACGDAVHIGRSLFLLAQASLLNGQEKTFGKEGVQKVISVVKGVVALFEEAHATTQLCKTTIFLNKVYEIAGHKKVYQVG